MTDRGRSTRAAERRLVLEWTAAMREALGDGPRKPRNRHEYQAEQYRRRKEAKSDAV